MDDVVRAMVAASTAPGIDRQIINVGCGSETRISDLAGMVLRCAGSPSEVVRTQRTNAGVARMCADLSLAGDLLGYRPRVEMEDGLRLSMVGDPRFSAERVA